MFVGDEDIVLSRAQLESATDEEIYQMLDRELKRETAFNPLLLFAEAGRRESAKVVKASNRLAMTNTFLGIAALVVAIVAVFTGN